MPVSSSTSAIEGGHGDRDGHESSGTDHLEALDRDECILRLKQHGVGRVGAILRGRPIVYPVNYAVHESAVLIRTRVGGDIDLATTDAWAVLEIDGADNLYHEGWSVLVVGRATHVSDPDELVKLKLMRLSPWADERRHRVVSIPLDDVSGRRLHHRSSVNFAETTGARRSEV